MATNPSSPPFLTPLRASLLFTLMASAGACGRGTVRGAGGAGAGGAGAIGGLAGAPAGDAAADTRTGNGGAETTGAGGASDADVDHVGGAAGAGSGGATAGGAGGGSGAGGASTGAGGASTDGGHADAAADPTDHWQILEPPLSRKVDILFMIDNSQSMQPLQDKLLTNFPVFMNILKALPMGLPDVHIAVISSDTGPGKFDLPDRHCSLGGDGGRFQSTARGTCAVSPLAAGQTFLQASSNQQVKNYTGDITDAFTCIAALGDQGCGFEGQLKSVRLALDPASAPPDNRGFLRDDAYLAVVLVTNEDDCSVPDDSDLVDPAQTLLSDPLGPLWSFRCNEFGHLCNINGTLQPPPRAAVQSLLGCVSNDGPTGKLTKLRDEIAFLKSLKSDPNKILVSAVAGPATPYGIELIPQSGLPDELEANIQHSCAIPATGEYGDPSVRLKQWLDAFGVNGVFQSICADSFAPALQVIAARVAGVFGPACVSGPFAGGDGGAPTACRVVDRTPRSDGSRSEVLLPSCADNANAAPCWTLMDDASGCLDGKRLSINRGAVTPPADLTTAFTCAACAPGTAEIGCP
jgi:hypothetical protein